ncbi:NAD(P)/FAD-dependent oxidoreductase [Acidianus sp. RZ1]|uniref:dihydrolipoyl dehydrogenase family protein n=1 Tax=Acidianus sp. RZ1 TaxID=1540082 RepID=UPI001492F503|nr:NAD(P)/FAD-dependent oxidoreductase [Acidianus sp. RZ1]NON62793.1 NAD(P)/FAD-dependent oxidoreductase [Acidianus sp. RZ1]
MNNIIVIGGGVGGYAAAVRSSELGDKVTIVEKTQLGGECINRACIPSKTLIDAVKLLNKLNKSTWISAEAELNYEKLMQFKTQVIENVRLKMEKRLAEQGVTIIQGEARLEEGGEVVVNSQRFNPDKVVLANGSIPISFPDFPLNGNNVLDPWTAMNREVPKKIIIVGGGVAGVELATLFSAMKREVTILELMPQLLPGFDKDLASAVKKRLEEKGINIYLNAKSKVVNSNGSVEFSVVIPSGEEKVVGDLAVITIGRKATTAGLKLKENGVEVDQRGYIKVNESGQTTNPSIYAAGDVAGPPLSATKAWKQGIVVGDNLGGVKSKMPSFYPSSIFADLEIGTVGKTVDDLKKSNVDAKEITIHMKDIPRAWTLNETEGFLKIVISQNKIVGAHMIGEGAAEVINTLALAMETGLTIDQIYPVLFSHPTVSEIITEAIQRAKYGEVY